MTTLGIVMAGGRNVRYGGLKAFAEVGGMRIVDRVIRALRSCTKNVAVIANDVASYSPLGLPLRSDEIPHAGALGGLLTALRWASEQDVTHVAVAACDMPFASAGLLEHMIERADGADAVLPESGGRRGVEPLFAVYATTCIPAIEAAIARDDLRMISFHDDVKIVRVPIDTVQQYGDPEMLFMNVNTPEELAAAERIAQERGV